METITIFKEILLNGEKFDFSGRDLPCLVYGIPHTGSSQFTVNMAVNLLKAGKKVLFFSAFEMAVDNLLNQIKGENLEKNLTIVPWGDSEKFLEAIKELIGDEETVVVIKNYDMFEWKVVESVINRKNIVLSGNIGKADFKEKIAGMNFSTKIFFSKPEIYLGVDVPVLEKYSAYFHSSSKKGIIKLN